MRLLPTILPPALGAVLLAGSVLPAGAVALPGRDTDLIEPRAPRGEEAAPSPEFLPVVRAFGDWTVTCDNLRSCTAIGYPSAEGSFPAPSLAIRRDAGPDAAAEAWITVTGEPEDWALRFDVARFDPALADLAYTETDSGVRYDIPADRLGDFIAGATASGVLTLDAGEGSRPRTISLVGATASLRFIDDVQGRADTVTAFVARGDAPAASVPPAPSLPLIAAPSVSVTALFGRPAAVTEAWRADCSGQGVEEVPEGAGYRLTGDDGATTDLWVVLCQGGAYNFGYRVYDTTGGGAEPVLFERPVDAGLAPLDPLAWNIGIDDLGGPAAPFVLREFDKGRGLGDCGMRAEHVWTGSGFSLTFFASEEHCAGRVLDDWPALWRAQVAPE